MTASQNCPNFPHYSAKSRARKSTGSAANGALSVSKAKPAQVQSLGPRPISAPRFCLKAAPVKDRCTLRLGVARSASTLAQSDRMLPCLRAPRGCFVNRKRSPLPEPLTLAASDPAAPKEVERHLRRQKAITLGTHSNIQTDVDSVSPGPEVAIRR